MTSTYYSSLSGMLAASYGLQNTSNNVANMQSNGFKRSDVFYSSLGSGSHHDDIGRGVRVSHTGINFSAGKYIETGSAADIAIIGHEFFVIRLKTNELVYTRDGSFEFRDGILTDKRTNGQVQGYDSAGNLVAIRENGPKESPGKASRDIFIEGSFVPHKITTPDNPGIPGIPDPTPPNPDPSIPTPGENPKPGEKPKKTLENITFSLDKIYDSKGKAHTVQFELEQYIEDSYASENKWQLVNISCSDAIVSKDYFFNKVIQFEGDDKPSVEESDVLKFTLNGQDVTLHFGTDDDRKSVKYNKLNAETNNTNITIYQNDGYGIGKPYSYSFDENGMLTYLYDNDQNINGIHIALARFDDVEHNLIQSQNNYFRAKSPNGIHYGRPNDNGFEVVQPRKLETSNVDSTTEFANIVILQRMFQACSQIMDIDKQLLEELEGKS